MHRVVLLRQCGAALSRLFSGLPGTLTATSLVCGQGGEVHLWLCWGVPLCLSCFQFPEGALQPFVIGNSRCHAAITFHKSEALLHT